MNRYLRTLLIGLICFPACAQSVTIIRRNPTEVVYGADSVSIRQLRAEVQSATSSTFSAADLNRLMKQYPLLLQPHVKAVQFLPHLQGQTVQPFPLRAWPNDPAYANTIQQLVTSSNQKHRLLAYMLLAATHDNIFENTLLDRMKTDSSQIERVWCGMALLHLRSRHTTPLFDFVIAFENWNNVFLFPMLVQLDPDSLRQTAHQRIQSTVLLEQIVAAQVLGYTQANPKTEQLLKQSVRTLPLSTKGYAIASMGRLGLGDLLPVLKPLVDSTATRQITLNALANSPSTSDRAYLFDLANRQDTVSTEVLRALSKSNKPESVRHWLQLLRTRPLPTNYYIFRGDLPFLQDEALLKDLLYTLQNLSNTQTLSQLLWALHGHSNEQVTNYLISLLTHPDRSVRYEAATSLRGNKSALLQAKLPGLLADSTGRTESLHHLVLEHGLDSLQSIYEQIYFNPHSAYERSQALQYLGTYTRPAHQSLFWQVLTTPTADNWDTRSAALGLGRLGDTGAIEAIIAVSRRERVGSDGNAQAYVMALGMLKGEKARQEIETYRNSPEANMRELARKLLNDW